MSGIIYPPPTQISQTIFNPYNYSSFDDALTIRQANLKYISKTGSDTAVGNITVLNNIQSNNFLANNNTVSSPAYSFFNEVNSGLYRFGTNDIRMSIQGVDSVGFQTRGMRLYGSISGNNALYSPSLLGYYEEATISSLFLYYDLANTINFKITRVGRIVNLTSTNTVSYGVPDANIDIIESSANFIPLRFRPSGTLYAGVTFLLENGSTFKFWGIRVFSDGVLWLQRESSTFATLNVYSFSCTWCI